MALFHPSGEGSAVADHTSLERRTAAIGRDWLGALRRHRAGFLSSRFWSDKLMNWSMRDAGFKVQLFRFIDTFPALRGADRVFAHLSDYLSQPGVTLPPGMGLGLKAGGLLKGAAAKAIAAQIESTARQFIAGSDPDDALAKLRQLWDRGIGFSVDLLGEACVSESEADVYAQRYLDLIGMLARHVGDWPAQPALQRDHLSPVPAANVSVKVSSLSSRIRPAALERTIDELSGRLIPILSSAEKLGVFVNFDMEEKAIQPVTVALFKRCCERVGFDAGLAMQAYLRSGEDDADDLIAWAKRAGRVVSVRLVKGAYWDYEVIHAEQMGWPAPVWSRKSDTDACFERMASRFIDATPRRAGEGGVKLAVGSHNVRSIAWALSLLETAGLPLEAVELQVLHGMAEALEAVAVEQGMRVREYVPIGRMIPGMAYLVRRLLENTSNESWLRAGHEDDVSDEALLASPHVGEPADAPPGRDAERHALTGAVEGVGNGRPFINEPLRDFSVADQREAFAAAVQRAKLPGVAVDATVDDADRAVAHAVKAFPGWRDTDVLQRAAVLTQAAAIMRGRRDELAALVLRESGKTWAEADGDVCEAIDFCEFYARAAVPLFQPRRLGLHAGELNEQWHEPRGVAAVISPWNFPLAICCGMTTAALVTGNTVIVKPAEQTPAIAKTLCDILWKAGAPPEVLHFLPGVGETVGAKLVRDPRIALIAFTGSKAVGLDILAATGVTADEQPFVKRVVCEMGGKNAIIVDSSADLDEAVLGVRRSAFGYAGQKCSACSRVVALDDVHDRFLARLIESTRGLIVGDPADPATDVGPVIDEDAAAKVRRYIELGKREGKLELAVEPPAGLSERVGKPVIGPHIFSGIEPTHRLAREEIFGPVLSVMRAADYDAALAIANGPPYRLTGGVFSRTPKHLARAKQAFRVGNLYLNRPITGALVGRQPFGGAGLSGVGSKAGGREYLPQFVEPRVVTENMTRRGFAPDVCD